MQRWAVVSRLRGAMIVRLRVVIVALAAGLLVYTGVFAWQGYRRMSQIGLTDQPCTADGLTITGRAADDWGWLCGYRAENQRLIASGIRPEVVMIGDSLTAAWPAHDPAIAPPIAMRGIGGQTSEKVLLRFRQDALSLRPRIIHLLVGSNDIAGYAGPFTATRYTDNMLDMIELARVHGQTVILGTIPPMRASSWLRANDPAPQIVRLNTRLRALATPGVVLADYHAALARPDGSPRGGMLMDDGIHLAPAGYAAIRPVFEAALAEARKRQAAR